MFNYKYDTDMTHWVYDEGRNGFLVSAKEEIPVGQEVRLGMKCRFSCITGASLIPSS